MSTKPHILFVCSLNQWRSPTAAKTYANDQRIEVRSAGISSHSVHRVSQRDLEWADLILVMEPEHKVRLLDRFKDMQLPAIECLDISNEFEFMDDALVALIRDGTETYLAARFGFGSNTSNGTG